MKIIFLDIDGVLLTTDIIRAGRIRGGKPTGDTVRNLNRITDATNAKIVVSSSWRFLGLSGLRERLASWGMMGRVVDVIPDLSKKQGSVLIATTKGKEIIAWLDKHPWTSAFVILDDDDDMGELGSHLVQTTFDDGLTMKDAERAIEILEATK